MSHVTDPNGHQTFNPRTLEPAELAALEEQYKLQRGPWQTNRIGVPTVNHIFRPVQPPMFCTLAEPVAKWNGKIFEPGTVFRIVSAQKGEPLKLTDDLEAFHGGWIELNPNDCRIADIRNTIEPRQPSSLAETPDGAIITA